jgi:hypothetical protein
VKEFSDAQTGAKLVKPPAPAPAPSLPSPVWVGKLVSALRPKILIIHVLLVLALLGQSATPAPPVSSQRISSIYLYAHANPVNGVDPSGHEFNFAGLVTTVAIQGSIGAVISGGVDYAARRSLQRAAKAAGWGFVIGGTLGGTFHGIRAVLAVRGAATALGATVTTTSTELITATTDGVLLGVIDSTGAIQLFKSGPGIIRNGVEILGHADLVKAGLVAAKSEGFSIAVQAGQVSKIFVNSTLNGVENGYVLATEKTAAVLDALGARAAQIFGY